MALFQNHRWKILGHRHSEALGAGLRGPAVREETSVQKNPGGEQCAAVTCSN
jgi:hypothetical protein